MFLYNKYLVFRELVYLLFDEDMYHPHCMLAK